MKIKFAIPFCGVIKLVWKEPPTTATNEENSTTEELKKTIKTLKDELEQMTSALARANKEVKVEQEKVADLERQLLAVRFSYLQQEIVSPTTLPVQSSGKNPPHKLGMTEGEYEKWKTKASNNNYAADMEKLNTCHSLKRTKRKIT